MNTDADAFEVAKERVLAEYYVKVNGRTALSFKEAIELREYAKSKTDLYSDQLTPDQVIWREVYVGLTEELRKSSPQSMAQIEPIENERDNLQRLKDMMAAKMAAHPHDYGTRVWWGFVIIGPFIGWMRSADLGTTVVYGLASWFTGMLFCIFALDSAEVQGKTALFLYHRLHMQGIAHWLYKKSLTIR